MRAWRWLPVGIALAVALVISALRVSGFRPLDLIDLRALDYRFAQRGKQPAAAQVVIVAVDDASIAARGRWPWSRPVVARLIERITAGGAAVIGVDIVQSEATAQCTLGGGDNGLADGALDAECRAALVRGSEAQDQALVDAVRDSRRTVLGYFFDRNSPTRSPYSGEAVYPTVLRGAGGSDGGRIPHETAITQNLPPLAAAASGLGYFNFLPDDDGLFRRVPLAIDFDGRLALPLSLAMLQRYWPDRPPTIRVGPAGAETVRLGPLVLPVEEDAQLLVNYRGPGLTIQHISAADVLADRVPPDTFRDKLVLLGVTAVGVGDVRAVPFDPVYPGVEIHATVLDNILRNDFIYRPAWAGSAALGLADVAVVFGLVLLLTLVLHYVRGVTAALIAAGTLGGYLVASQFVFTRTGAVLSAAYPTVAVLLTYVALGVHHYVVIDREKRHNRRMLDLYLSPALAHFISERPETLKLGGEKSDRTVLFSDVKSFTLISERLKPEQLVELLNYYLGEMTDIIFAHDGMLDKYMGDGVMAVWGAPLPQVDHAARACRAALAMIDRMEHLNTHCIARGWPPIHIRIGLNSGPMVFGNMGSPGHLSLTVMGDAVNLGARLEGINKLYGTTIIAGEATVLAAGDLITARELDLVRVRGKAETTRIYEILGRHRIHKQFDELIEHFAAGLAAYRARDWDGATAAFERAMRVRPNDGASDLYLRRCKHNHRTPPPPNWDAVTTFEDA